MFLPQTNCTREWPVEYVVNHEKHKGWISPVSHEIVQSPTEVSCPPDSWYFDTGSEVLLLSNRTVPYNIPTTPSMYEPPTSESRQFDISSAFHVKGHYSASDISQFNTIYQMARSNAINLHVHEIMRKHREGVPLSQKEALTAEAIRFFAFRGFWDNLELMIMVAGSIG
jgi:hypothetical protein